MPKLNFAGWWIYGSLGVLSVIAIVWYFFLYTLNGMIVADSNLELWLTLDDSQAEGIAGAANIAYVWGGVPLVITNAGWLFYMLVQNRLVPTQQPVDRETED